MARPPTEIHSHRHLARKLFLSGISSKSGSIYQNRLPMMECEQPAKWNRCVLAAGLGLRPSVRPGRWLSVQEGNNYVEAGLPAG